MTLLGLSGLALLPSLTHLGSPIRVGHQQHGWALPTCVCLPSHRNGCPPAHWELCCCLPGDSGAAGLVLPHLQRLQAWAGCTLGKKKKKKSVAFPLCMAFFHLFHMCESQQCFWRVQILLCPQLGSQTFGYTLACCVPLGIAMASGR